MSITAESLVEKLDKATDKKYLYSCFEDEDYFKELLQKNDGKEISNMKEYMFQFLTHIKMNTRRKSVIIGNLLDKSIEYYLRKFPYNQLKIAIFSVGTIVGINLEKVSNHNDPLVYDDFIKKCQTLERTNKIKFLDEIEKIDQFSLALSKTQWQSESPPTLPPYNFGASEKKFMDQKSEIL